MGEYGRARSRENSESRSMFKPQTHPYQPDLFYEEHQRMIATEEIGENTERAALN